MEWVPVALIALVLVFYGLSRIFGKSPKAKKDPVEEAHQEAADIKTAAGALLEEELATVVADKEELDRITKIENDEDRLKALANFGNSRRRR